MPEGVFPYEIFPSIDDLREANKELRSLHNKYEIHPPSREIAFNVALKTEMSAGELHFQSAMAKSTDSEILQLFPNT